MIDNNEYTRSNLKNAGNNLLYLMIGGGIGATLALLFAPKSGRELRQDVSEGVKYGLETANEKVSQFKEVAGEKVSHLKETADDYYHKAQDKVSELYRVASKAVNDGTSEAKALANSAANEAQDMLQDVSKTQEPPLFETGTGPFNQRSGKTGIL